MLVAEFLILFFIVLFSIIIFIYRKYVASITSIGKIKEEKKGYEGVIWRNIRNYVEEGKFSIYTVSEIMKFNVDYFYKKGNIDNSMYKSILNKINKIIKGKFVLNKKRIFIQLLNEYIKIKNGRNS
jgi:hypothetical protein